MTRRSWRPQRHRSEKLPPLERERRRNRDSEERLAEAKRKREERALAKTKLVTETVELKVQRGKEAQCTLCVLAGYALWNTVYENCRSLI